jgi:hypothetical protein
MAQRWSAVLARLGMPTGDGRIIAPGGVTNRDLPLPLMWQRSTGEGHGGAVVVGSIETMEFGVDSVTATGSLLDSAPEEVRELISADVIGPSVDLDDMDYMMDDQERIVITSARIAGATLVPIPAFADVSIHLSSETYALEVTESVTASAASRPPLSWFTNPKLDDATPLTVTAEGRVYGHVAVWGTCHVGLPGCVTPPSSNTEYAHFLVGAEMTQEGVSVPVGKLTVGGGHATPDAGYQAAAAHYDDVSTAVASVFAGEDEHGIWVAGYVIPGTPQERVDELLRSPLSGDWRRIGGNLEMIAAHAVNVPGFPIPRAKVKFSLGHQVSLVGNFSVKPGKTRTQSKDDGGQARAAWAKSHWKGRD